jgi:DNA-binding CsgD family transcriptional regulator
MSTSTKDWVDEQVGLALSLRSKDPYLALMTAEGAATVAESARYFRGKARALLANAGAAFALGDYKQSLASCQEALALGRRLRDRSIVIEALWRAAEPLPFLGESSLALASLNEFLSMFKDGDDPQHLSSALNAAGIVYDCLNNPQKALEYFEFAQASIAQVTTVPEPEKKRRELTFLANCALCLGSLGRTDEAHAVVLDTAPKLKALSLWDSLARLWLNFADAAVRANRLSLAYEMVMSVSSLPADSLSDRNRCAVHGSLAELALLEGRWEDARREMQEALSYLPVLGLRTRLQLLALNAAYLEASSQWPQANAQMISLREEELVAHRQTLDMLVNKSASVFDLQLSQRRRSALPAAIQPEKLEVAATVWPQLSAQQQVVVAQLSTGKTNKQIARDIGLSPLTVRQHVSAVLTRLQMKTRSEVVGAFARMSSGQPTMGTP